MGGFNADGLSFIATKLGDPKMLDSFTCAMCVNFARPLIELDVTFEFKDELVVAIPCLNGSGYMQEKQYGWNMSGSLCGVIPVDSLVTRLINVVEILFLRPQRLTTMAFKRNYYVLGNTSKPTNGPNSSVVKPESSIPVSNSFSTLEEDNDNFMDDLVDDTRKNVEAPPRKTGIWSSWKAERNIVVSLETELHYIDRDVLEFANMDEMMEVAEHGNVPSEHG
ncbi:hypothetical protein Tco_1075406 [Tanacetum coccineum]